MNIEDRLYLQMIVGLSIGIVLGILAFTMVTTCAIGSLCATVDAAESLPLVDRDLRDASSQFRLVPQFNDNDLDAIIVEWAPLANSALDNHIEQSSAIKDGVLPTGHQLSSAPDSMPMPLDDKTINHLITLNATRNSEDTHSWNARDWMIITGSYNLLAAAEFDAEIFKDAGYNIQVFFRKGEFQTAIVGYEDADAASIDLVTIRNELRVSAQLGQLENWCGATIVHGQYTMCEQNIP